MIFSVRRPRVLFATSCVLSVCAFTACPFPEPEPDGGFPVITEVSCAAQFVPSDSGFGCDPLVAEGCGVGTMPMLGNADCQPVGWQQCPAGFERSADSWGCLDVQPTTACTGATMERLGQRVCQPVGDCDAFPPAAATLFVDDSFATQDATHFRTINAALAAAPAGATVAVDEGSYTESLELTRPVTVVGRCAAKVQVRNPVGGAAPGVGIRVAVSAEVSGLTLSGFSNGAGASTRAQLTLRDVVITASGDYGLYVSDPGSVLRVFNSVVRDSTGTGPNVGHGAEVELGGTLELTGVSFVNHHRYGLFVTGTGSRITAEQLIVRDTRATSTGFGGMGVVADPGSIVRLKHTAISGSRHRGIRVTAAALHMEESLVRDTEPQPDGQSGQGVTGFDGAKITLDHVSLRGNTEAGVHVQGAGAELFVIASSIWNTRSALDIAAGASATLGAAMNLISSAVVNNLEMPVSYSLAARGKIERSLIGSNQQGPNDGPRAINVTAACIEINDSAVIDNAMAGLAVIDSADAGCETTVNRTLIANTRTRDDGSSGRGVSVQRSTLRMVDSVVRDNHETGIWVSSAGRLVMQGGTIRSTRPEPSGRYGFGVVGRSNAVIELTGVDVRSCPGIGLALANSTGTVLGGNIARNGIAVDVREGTQLREGGDGGLVPGTLLISPETQFVDNLTRVGMGNLPLPELGF